MKGQAYHYVPVRVPVNARAGGAAAKQSKRELLSSPQPFVSAAWLISLRTEYEMANKISAVEVAAAVVERQPPYELPPFAAVLLLYALPTAAAVSCAGTRSSPRSTSRSGCSRSETVRASLSTQ